MKLPYTVTHDKKNLLTTVRMEGIKSGWEQRFLLTADRHLDHPTCDRRMVINHLQQALEQKAGNFDFGDLACVMQGKSDRRGHKGAVLPELAGDDYLNKVRDYIVDTLGPYAQIIHLLGMGNHETAKIQHEEYDIIGDVAELLNLKYGGRVWRGAYEGAIRFMFRYNKTKKTSRILYYHHGSGGASPVSHGLPKALRRQAAVRADIYVTGHIHDPLIKPNMVRYWNTQGKLVTQQVTHIQLPSYKDISKMNGMGWETEKEMTPQPTGAVWLVFWLENDEIKHKTEWAT